jgi:hypothetical protein
MVHKIIRRLLSNDGRDEYKGRNPSGKSKDSKVEKMIKLAKSRGSKKKKAPKKAIKAKTKKKK